MAAEGIPSMEEMQMRQQQMAEMEERRSAILDQILEPGAKDRIKRMALVKEGRARSIEDSLINAAKSGKLKGKVTEEQLIVMLQQLSGEGDEASGGGAVSGKKKIVVQRRNYGMDDEDDDDDSDLV